ncbi:MAG: HipA family kinase [Acidobacteriota bacterium]
MPVNARRFIRKMRGGAQAHLLEADDGKYYIVKFQNNPQHRRILVNELIAAEILAHLQVSAPEYRLIRVTPEFLGAHPDVYLQSGTHRIPVEPGWHFGSRHPGDPDLLAIYDFIPDALLSQVANAEQFRAVLVFDRWTGNADGRQSVFFRAQLKDWLARPGVPPRKQGFVALMIDHGFIFNGPHWNFTESALTGLYPRRMVYQTVRSVDDFEPWLSRVTGFPEEVLDKALRQLPPEWVAGDESLLEKTLETLLRRKKRIAELLHGCREAPGNPFPRWSP